MVKFFFSWWWIKVFWQLHGTFRSFLSFLLDLPPSYCLFSQSFFLKGLVPIFQIESLKTIRIIGHKVSWVIADCSRVLIIAAAFRRLLLQLLAERIIANKCQLASVISRESRNSKHSRSWEINVCLFSLNSFVDCLHKVLLIAIDLCVSLVSAVNLYKHLCS